MCYKYFQFLKVHIFSYKIINDHSDKHVYSAMIKDSLYNNDVMAIPSL